MFISEPKFSGASSVFSRFILKISKPPKPRWPSDEKYKLFWASSVIKFSLLLVLIVGPKFFTLEKAPSLETSAT